MARISESVTLDRTTLRDPVRRALGRETVEIIDWRWETLQGGADPKTGGVYRVVGRAQDHGAPVAWALVLKVLHPAGDDADPSGGAYWKREVLAYQSGLLAALPGGLAAPRCFGSGVDRDETAWLWLEEVTDTGGSHWPLACYGSPAYHLGQFNGAYLGEHALPPQPWLSRGWLGIWLAGFPVERAALRRAQEHPLVRRVCPATRATRLLRLVAERATFLAALDRLPQTFCHHDAWRRNLFLRPDRAGHEQTVLIDWADAGSGALGQDLGSFVWAPVAFCDLHVSVLPELEELAWSHYLDGLRTMGWTGNPAAVRLGYTADLALRSLVAGWLCTTILPDESRHAEVEQWVGRPLEEIIENTSGLLAFLLDRGDEARSLMGVASQWNSQPG